MSKKRDRPLTARQAIYAAEVAKGTNKHEARRLAGYSKKGSTSDFTYNPAINARIAAIHNKTLTLTGFDAKKAFDRAEELINIELANPEKRSMMAIAKLFELQMKLNGLLIERVEVKSVDLTPAFQKMHDRDAEYMKTKVILAPRKTPDIFDETEDIESADVVQD